MRVIKPPQQISQGLSCKKVFLAGSIEMGRARDWQNEITSVIAEEVPKPLQIMNPRRDDWDSSWEQSVESPQFYQQVNWELEALDIADLIIMYFDPDTTSPITLLELGLHAEHRNLYVCCPTGYYRKGNVDMVCERYDIPHWDNWEDFKIDIVQILRWM